MWILMIIGAVILFALGLIIYAAIVTAAIYDNCTEEKYWEEDSGKDEAKDDSRRIFEQAEKDSKDN